MATESGFWTRIKQNTSSLTSNLSSLSLGNDSDGKTEYETLVHKALIKFYQEKAGGQYPDWLIENDPEFNGSVENYNTTNLPTNNKFYPIPSSANQYEPKNQEQKWQPQQSHSQRPNNNIYRTPSARTQTPASASLHDMYKSSRNSTGSASSAGSGASGALASRPNAIRDRLKNGQRSNYSGTSSATASRLQSSWARR